MNHRIPQLLGTALVAVLTLSACSSASSGAAATTTTTGTGATINIGSLYEPQNLDNTAGGGQGITEAFNGNVYEGLFRLTDSGDVEPLLAANHTVSTDGLTYTFTLRKGVTFQSVKALTSADVKHSIEQVISDSSKSARKSSFPPISAITTPDDLDRTQFGGHGGPPLPATAYRTTARRYSLTLSASSPNARPSSSGAGEP